MERHDGCNTVAVFARGKSSGFGQHHLELKQATVGIWQPFSRGTGIRGSSAPGDEGAMTAVAAVFVRNKGSNGLLLWELS